jgi:hypothetical protein
MGYTDRAELHRQAMVSRRQIPVFLPNLHASAVQVQRLRWSFGCAEIRINNIEPRLSSLCMSNALVIVS